jgi:hypothetical protein
VSGAQSKLVVATVLATASLKAPVFDLPSEPLGDRLCVSLVVRFTLIRLLRLVVSAAITDPGSSLLA